MDSSILDFVAFLALLAIFWLILWEVAGRIFRFWPFRFILAVCLIPVFPWVCLVYIFMPKNKK